MKKQTLIFIILILLGVLLWIALSLNKDEFLNLEPQAKYQQALKKAKAGDSSVLSLLKEGVLTSKVNDYDVYLALKLCNKPSNLSTEILCNILTKINNDFDIKSEILMLLNDDYLGYDFVNEACLRAFSNSFQMDLDIQNVDEYYSPLLDFRVACLIYLSRSDSDIAVPVLLKVLEEKGDMYEAQLHEQGYDRLNDYFHVYYPAYPETWDYLAKFANTSALPVLEKCLNYTFMQDRKKINEENKDDIEKTIRIIKGEEEYIDTYKLEQQKKEEQKREARKIRLPLDLPPERNFIDIEGKRLSLDEAYPILEKRAFFEDDVVRFKALEKLADYGNRLKGKKIITELIDFYPKEQDEVNKGIIIVILSSCGDERANPFLEKLGEREGSFEAEGINSIKEVYKEILEFEAEFQKKLPALRDEARAANLPLDVAPPEGLTIVLHGRGNVTSDGKELTLGEAYPILEDAVLHGDKYDCIDALNYLFRYRNELKGKEIVAALIDMYHNDTRHSLIQSGVVSALSACGDERAGTFYNELCDTGGPMVLDEIIQMRKVLDSAIEYEKTKWITVEPDW
jgi:hypothetical protein